MDDAVITAAENYTRHTITCPVCSDKENDICLEGRKLLLAFQDALQDAQSGKWRRDYDA